MKTHTRLFIVSFTLTSMFVLTLSWASGGDRRYILKPTDKHPAANGTAVITVDHINLQARGLNPEAVYTVWFVKMKPKKSETGAGTGTLHVQNRPLGQWQLQCAPG